MDSSIFENKAVFMVAVAVVALVTAALAAFLLGGGPEEIGYALAGGIVTAVIIAGTYALGRKFGHPHSHAVAEAAIAFGVIYLLAVTYRLLTEFGERTTGEVIAGLAGGVIATALFIAAVVLLGRVGPSPN